MSQSPERSGLKFGPVDPKDGSGPFLGPDTSRRKRRPGAKQLSTFELVESPVDDNNLGKEPAPPSPLKNQSLP